MARIFPAFLPTGPYDAARLLCRLLALTALLAACPVQAQQPSAQGDEGEAAQTVIPVKSVADDRLAERLQGVFAAIDRFKGVTVSVQKGVVRLTGSADSSRHRDSAGELASRFEGVVYVINDIEVRAEVERRVAPAWRKLRDVADVAVERLPLLAIAVVVGFGFWLLALLLTAWDRPWERLAPSAMLRGIARQTLRLAITLAGVMLALEILDLSALVGALAGAAGVLGLAIGFAFRDIVENYLSGVLLGLRSPFAMGDWIEVGGFEGSITRLTSRELVLMTLDGNHVRIPNSQVFKSTIVNYTRNPMRAFSLEVGVGVDEDLERVRRAGVDALLALQGVMRDPAPEMRVLALGDFNVVVAFRGWVDQRAHEYLKVRSEALRVLKAGLDEAQVDMPFPEQIVHLRRERPGEVEEPKAPVPVRVEAARADTGKDQALDRQLREDIAKPGEENLLAPAGETAAPDSPAEKSGEARGRALELKSKNDPSKGGGA